MTGPLTPRARLALLVAPIVLLVSLSLRWYAPTIAGIRTSDTYSGWEALDVIDVYLVFVGVGAWLLLVADARGLRPPRELTRAADVAAGLALVAVLYRIVSPPDDLASGFITQADPSAGPFVCLAGVLLLLWGLRPSARSSA